MWNVSWLRQKYPLHTHRYDLVGISYADGDRLITMGDAPGRLVNTKPWVFQTNRASVTHVEEGASDPPMRAVLIEVKAAKPRAAAADAADGLRQVAGAPAWENDRAAAWIGIGKPATDAFEALSRRSRQVCEHRASRRGARTRRRTGPGLRRAPGTRVRRRLGDPG